MLRGRNFLKLFDFSAEELRYLLDLAAQLKRAKRAGNEVQHLAGKNIALIFEKSSTRTRCAFEVGAYDQGAHVTYLGPSGTQIGAKESMKDTARVLGRMYDGIQYRGFGQERVETLGDCAGVPVWNGLTDEYHPTQILADLLTIEEHVKKPLSEVRFCYLGDGRNNMGHSILAGASIMGMDVRIAAPIENQPTEAVVEEARRRAATSGAKILLTEEAEEGVRGADVVCTDVWVSMGEPEEVWASRIKSLAPYQVNAALMASAAPKAIFMHCLPAFHNRETKVGEEIYQRFGLDGMEVTDEVFESSASVVFDEAENRLHTIKAVMVATLNPPAV